MARAGDLFAGMDVGVERHELWEPDPRPGLARVWLMAWHKNLAAWEGSRFYLHRDDARSAEAYARFEARVLFDRSLGPLLGRADRRTAAAGRGRRGPGEALGGEIDEGADFGGEVAGARVDHVDRDRGGAPGGHDGGEFALGDQVGGDDGGELADAQAAEEGAEHAGADIDAQAGGGGDLEGLAAIRVGEGEP